ncbi:hypothetical protein D3C72_1044050 [compost metagenome]
MQRQIFILLNHVKLNRGWRRDNLAFVGLQLREARFNVRRNRENQMLCWHLAVPVIRVSNVADQRINFILLQHVRAGTNWPGVDVFRRPFFEHSVCVFG